MAACAVTASLTALAFGRFWRSCILVASVTLAAAIAAVLAPHIADETQSTLGAALGGRDLAPIFARNLATFSIPAALVWILQPWEGGARVAVGSVICVIVLAPNAILVGLAIGSYGARLVPYLPHLPLEWAAFSWGVATWWIACLRKLTARQLIALFLVNCPLLLAAALVEVYATP